MWRVGGGYQPGGVYGLLTIGLTSTSSPSHRLVREPDLQNREEEREEGRRGGEYIRRRSGEK